jgi:hypothetical protein
MKLILKENGITMIDPFGLKYKGKFLKGKMNGLGTLTSQKGDKYEGEFKENKFHGHGTHTLVNGDIYI